MKPIYLMLTGLSLSGKTFLVSKIIEKHPKQFFKLDSRSIHDYLNQFEIFQDDNSIEGTAYKMRQEATDTFQRDIVTVVTKNKYSVIHDSCNRIKDERSETLKLVKQQNPDISTVLIYVNSPKKDIFKRAGIEDDSCRKRNLKPVWNDLINKQLETYEVPIKEEVEYFFEYDGKNYEDVLKFLENILK